MAQFVAVASGGELEECRKGRGEARGVERRASSPPGRSPRTFRPFRRARLRFRRSVRKDVVRIGARAGPSAWEMVMKVPACRAFRDCYDARPHPLNPCWRRGRGDPCLGANRHRVALLSSASPSATPQAKGRGRPPSCQSTPAVSQRPCTTSRTRTASPTGAGTTSSRACRGRARWTTPRRLASVPRSDPGRGGRTSVRRDRADAPSARGATQPSGERAERRRELTAEEAMHERAERLGLPWSRRPAGARRRAGRRYPGTPPPGTLPRTGTVREWDAGTASARRTAAGRRSSPAGPTGRPARSPSSPPSAPPAAHAGRVGRLRAPSGSWPGRSPSAAAHPDRHLDGRRRHA